MSSSTEITIEITPTVFSQYNAKNNFPTDQTTNTLTVKRLKHGHLRSMQKLKESDQIHYLMSELTGISQLDLDELDVEDSAKLSEVIFGFMRRYAQIAREMTGT